MRLVSYGRSRRNASVMAMAPLACLAPRTTYVNAYATSWEGILDTTLHRKLASISEVVSHICAMGVNCTRMRCTARLLLTGHRWPRRAAAEGCAPIAVHCG